MVESSLALDGKSGTCSFDAEMVFNDEIFDLFDEIVGK